MIRGASSLLHSSSRGGPKKGARMLTGIFGIQDHGSRHDPASCSIKFKIFLKPSIISVSERSWYPPLLPIYRRLISNITWRGWDIRDSYTEIYPLLSFFILSKKIKKTMAPSKATFMWHMCPSWNTSRLLLDRVGPFQARQAGSLHARR